ncbi:hypothetical protein F4777DRAFT_361449 [Nemania sp. FL0916]|nr:hypothetical protein F4777DRAFT_361449 [Nemania sp. FL0916]
MDISSLQVPKAGRSRFSKALPMPPPGLDDRPQTARRELPDVPPAPLPPKKNSVLITHPSLTTLRSRDLDSPLPVLPIMAEAPRPRAQAGPITRKPVAQMLSPPSIVEPSTKTKAMKRQSSISSLLSAYSRSSSDWAQRSSHESDYTKDSEPSYSPEQEEMNGLPPAPPKKSLDTVIDSVSDGMSEVTSYTIIDSFPPPPPLKDPARLRPHTPDTVQPADRLQDKAGESAVSLSPMSHGAGGSPRAGREIWRRRASTRSDASLVIADLKLPGSNGSTASTSHTPAVKAEAPSMAPSILPPLPPKPNQQPAVARPAIQIQSTAPLPPRTSSIPASLPGRNIRPVKKTESVDEDAEMKKLLKLSKLKDFIRSGSSDDDSDQERNRSKKGEKDEPYGAEEPADAKSDAKSDKPELPTIETLLQNKQQPQLPYAPANAPKPAAGEASLAPAPPPGMPGPPPYAPGKAPGMPLSRRPVGAAPTQFAGSQPSNPVGTLPHPRQRQQHQQPPRTSPTYPPSQYGPTSPTTGPRSDSTFAQPGPSGVPPSLMAGFHRGPGATSSGTPGSHPPRGSDTRVSRSRSGSRSRGPSPQQFSGLSRQSSSAAQRSPPFHSQALSQVAEQGQESEEPMSDSAAAGVAFFPRNQHSGLESTIDGIWPPNPLADRHYKCLTNHSRLIKSRNSNYPLACQTCGVADREARFVCAFCNLRICMPCLNLLNANGRKLEATVAALRQQGRIRDWSQYTNQNIRQQP